MRDSKKRRIERASGSALAAGVILSLLATACTMRTDDTSLRQRLDESSGATITTLDAPAAFSRDRPMLAANARDYVYMGPVEINRAGERSYALWVAYCSTIDRTDGQRFAAPANAWLLVDDAPMELGRPAPGVDLADWLYEAPVVGGDKVVYALTRAQLQLIARSRHVRVVIDGADDESVKFEPWRDGLSRLSDFARYLDPDEISAVANAND
jgi:hypothetical protein